MRVVVLHSDIAAEASKDEQDVLEQADDVCAALAAQGYEPTILTVSSDLDGLIEALTTLQPAFVFNLVESIKGEGRFIHWAPSILDYLSIPYTGARTEAIFITSQKLMAKKLLCAYGIDTPPWIVEGVTCAVPFIQDRYVVKSIWEHASIGLDGDSVIHARDMGTLYDEMASRKTSLGGGCFAERFIDGREFNLSLLAGQGEPQILPPAEILFEGYSHEKPRVVGYRAKWVEDSFEYCHTKRVFQFSPEDAPLLRNLKDLAICCWRLFELRGYARVDFRVDESGKPWVLEINANPCLSKDSGFVAASQQAGLGFNQVIERIITDI